MNPYEDMTPEPWMADGVCATTGEPDDWFADEGAAGRTQGSMTREVIRVCQSCPVVNQCLQYALDDASLTGVWGATTTQTRRRLRLKVVA